MNRHSFRWESLAFGLIFLAVVGSWTVRKQDVLSARDLSLAGSALLIVAGAVGVAATVWPRGTTTHHTPEEDLDEEAHPQH